MKKVMFAAAVAAAGLVFGIESANTVGYTTTTARQGYTLFVPAFDNIGSEGLDIQKIVPNTEASGITIQTFTEAANMDVMYYYVPSGKAGAGWYTSGRGTAATWANKTFAKGEGFMAYFPSENITFNVSGEVGLATKTLENVRSGYTLMGNFRPVSYSIQKIVPATEDAGVTLQTFTDAANMDVMYYYVPSGKAGAGWYTSGRGTAATYADKSFAAGEGFMLYLPSVMNVTFQSAETTSSATGE